MNNMEKIYLHGRRAEEQDRISQFPETLPLPVCSELPQGSSSLTLNPLTHLKTLYLLVASDLKTTLLPATIFALVATLSGTLLTSYTTSNSLISQSHNGHHKHTPSPPLELTPFLINLLKSVIWTLLSLLVFNLANQRLPSSILEDQLNKPYRCLPSGRLTPTSARHLLLILLPITVLLTNFVLGGRNEALFLMALTWAYNDLGAGDEHFLVRHVTNALGFVTFGAGAAAVCIGPGRELNTTAHYWLFFISLVITFTIQFQDMEDQEGDSLRDRKTLPLVYGDTQTRKLNAAVILAFSAAAPLFWGLGWKSFMATFAISGWIAWRCLTGEGGVRRDKVTFRLWCLWLMWLYLLPLGMGGGVLEGLVW